MSRPLYLLTLVALPLLSTLSCGSAPPSEVAEVTHPVEQIFSWDARDLPAACSNQGFADGPGSGPVPVRPDRTDPPLVGRPTTVNVFLYILALDEIDEWSNSFHFQGYGGLVWCDPRLAFDEAEHGSDVKLVHATAVERLLEETWWPGVFVPSRTSRPERINQVMLIYSDGTVGVSNLLSARLVASYDFRDFPFDRHTLAIPVQSEFWQADTVRFEDIEGLTGFDEGFEIPEWHIAGYSTSVDRIAATEDYAGLSRFVMEIDVDRRVGYYVWKIFVPLLIIVAIPWSCFWMSRDVLAQRQRQAATGVLTLVAFQFVAAATLPRVSYITLMDAVFLWSFITAASAMFFNVRHARAYRIDKELGLGADRRMRWLYPFIYVAGLTAIVLLYQAV